MPAAKKAKQASRTKTVRSKKAAPPKAKAKSKAPLKLVPKTKPKKVVAGEPRNIIMELWKAKEEKRRNEAPHTKFHQTGPPANNYVSHHKHDRFARYHTGARRKAS